MKASAIVLSVVAAMPVPALLPGQEAATAPSSQPAASGVSSSRPSVLATVGRTRITSDRIDKLYAMRSAAEEVPADEAELTRQKIFGAVVMQELARAYVAGRKIEATDDDVRRKMDAIARAASVLEMTARQLMEANGITEDMIRDEVRLTKMIEGATTKQKLGAYIKAHPDYFNGTTVRAGHILVKVDPWASTVDQKAALAKIEGIAADLKGGKIDFEAAARQFSDCPSKDLGGDLGEHAFFDPVLRKRLDMEGMKAAFGAKVGQTTGIVRTRLGFHIVKVTARTEGKDAPGQAAEEVAWAAMVADLVREILQLPMTTCPIVINK